MSLTLYRACKSLEHLVKMHFVSEGLKWGLVLLTSSQIMAMLLISGPSYLLTFQKPCSKEHRRSINLQRDGRRRRGNNPEKGMLIRIQLEWNHIFGDKSLWRREC